MSDSTQQPWRVRFQDDSVDRDPPVFLANTTAATAVYNDTISSRVPTTAPDSVSVEKKNTPPVDAAEEEDDVRLVKQLDKLVNKRGPDIVQVHNTRKFPESQF